MAIVDTDTFPAYYEDPTSISWDTEKMQQVLELLGLDSRRADALVSLTIANQEIIIERPRSDAEGIPALTRNVIRIR